MTAWRFLFLSLVIHLLIWLIALNRPPVKFEDKEKSVEVSIIDKNAKQPKTFVRQALPPLDMLKPEPPKDAKFLSERDQNVKKQMKSQNSGLTQNGNSNFNDRTKNQQMQQQSGGQKSNAQGETGATKDLSRFAPGPLTNSPSVAANNVMTSSNDYLPDVTNGPINALNSERFIYYSFFSRIEERLYPLWERNVESTLERLPPSTQKQLVNHNWITSLEVLIDSEGHYVDCIIQESSGVQSIDMAAVSAFAEAKFFPNPPKEMIKADHRIHLNYAFVVQEGPSGWHRPSL